MSKDDETHFGFRSIPVAEKAGRVAEVFRSVASRYDVMNDLMSLGTHRLMKQIAVEYTVARRGHTILDLAGGTGDLAARLARIVGDEGSVVLCDINDAMLAEGRDRLINQGVGRNVTYLQADAERLPFPDETFNAVTIGFGLRNFTDKDAALAEVWRILRPHGRLVVLEFSTPENATVRNLYGSFTSIWPTVGKLVTGDRDSYQYLVESIRVHPTQEVLRQMMLDAGFSRVDYHNLINGVVAVHVGRKRHASD
ncbi:MAG: bifunctional demethylmenaquinone methyltransferase/2-methoxy-6-polyprenyl-1,4-benzoquinol methylase UbiE [Proteobacteria bacterium]|jgi:demethylmenaquinone methyltransferase/2-methoxy-6-polyprenyl-1,4-benzoquinol methylase|nr:bifunctional demethylmenaquinone methyltransferase/2-methoxy-6-polyprenyl-1,4-benzoquinol methylase UbiE [Pseudomonadota bacterium]MDA1298787.1 bifunctional demethylmenaquinone methyltransferase/2-methoxy-6-polyprenyl-1,4-benzoquinol methylase UbiE [Pseudomonadota bacterium]